ncbi:hypothetical protein Tco_0523692 [Tanacetum coccineum]
MDDEPNPSSSGSQEQLDEFDAWMDEFGTNDDEVPTEDESRKEDLSLQLPNKPILVYQSYQKDPKAPPITLLNQDLFYMKHGNSGPKKYIISLHNFPAVPFLENDIEELTTGWEKKRDKHEEVYSESKIVEVVRTLYDLGHEHKYITKIMVRRANGKFNAITESDYKHLNKNDIEDLYLMYINGKVKDYRENGLLGSLSVFIRSCVIWERVHDFPLGMESYQQKVNLTTPTITFPGIKRKKLLTITSKPVVGLIYENRKKEKRVMILK